MSDIYDQGIDYLVENPDEAFRAWDYGCVSRDDLIGKIAAGRTPAPADVDGFYAATRLFQAMSIDGHACNRPLDGRTCGCLTQIRDRGYRVAWTEALTSEILADGRLPVGGVGACDFVGASRTGRRAMLLPFAEWQRRFDVEVREKGVGEHV